MAAKIDWHRYEQNYVTVTLCTAETMREVNFFWRHGVVTRTANGPSVGSAGLLSLSHSARDWKRRFVDGSEEPWRSLLTSRTTSPRKTSDMRGSWCQTDSSSTAVDRLSDRTPSLQRRQNRAVHGNGNH